MTHRKILLLVLSFSLHSLIIGMKTETIDVQVLLLIKTEAELERHARNLVKNIFTLMSAEERDKHVSPLIHWLVQKRNEISDPSEWSDLVKKLDDSIKLPTGDAGSNAGAIFFICIPQGTKNVIMANATKLQPNQNAAELIEKINENINEFYTFDYSACGF